MAYQEYPIPVSGGTLNLCVTAQDIMDDPLEIRPVATVTTHLSFEYRGRLPKDMALELVRQTPDDGVRINGKTVLEFLEGL